MWSLYWPFQRRTDFSLFHHVSHHLGVEFALMIDFGSGTEDAVALVVMMLLTSVSDRTRRRGIFVAIVFIINAIGWIILLAVVNNQHARYFACFCITVGGYAAVPLMMSWTGKCIQLLHKASTKLALYSKQYGFSKSASGLARNAQYTRPVHRHCLPFYLPHKPKTNLARRFWSQPCL